MMGRTNQLTHVCRDCGFFDYNEWSPLEDEPVVRECPATLVSGEPCEGLFLRIDKDVPPDWFKFVPKMFWPDQYLWGEEETRYE